MACPDIGKVNHSDFILLNHHVQNVIIAVNQVIFIGDSTHHFPQLPAFSFGNPPVLQAIVDAGQIEIGRGRKTGIPNILLMNGRQIASHFYGEKAQLVRLLKDCPFNRHSLQSLHQNSDTAMMIDIFVHLDGRKSVLT
ncbi:MAG: hypothetical protein Q4C54_06140 [Clostridia bacterium]|nr:hypothetical protein [Clostridia bacterium]